MDSSDNVFESEESRMLLQEQAAELEAMVPQVLRRLFAATNGTLEELPLAQLRICNILQTGPRSMSAIGEEIGISVSAVTQIADRMERSGLVERASSVEDRRLKHLSLSRHGETLMRERRERRVRRVVNVLQHLNEKDRVALMAALHQLLDAGLAAAYTDDCASADPVPDNPG